ncbi:hypothetical protein F5X99DRAFT_333900 [Biscogniauxia marginata]|nr:hypothetical protein F5X99DRAFT_333900 [Biscogniauxia marginata]
MMIPKRPADTIQLIATEATSSESLDSPTLATPGPQNEPTARPGIRQRFSKHWAEARHQALEDLRAVRWLRAGLWLLFFLWIGSLLGCFVFLGLYSAFPRWLQPTTSACQPDGSFNPFEDGYSPWAASTFFQIGLGLGNFTFTEAKVIDISWDIIIGRGGQAVMAMIAWRVFADYVTTSMEVSPITYATFFIIFLHDSPSILSTVRLVRDFIFSRSLKSKVAMLFMISSMIFILGWPTFASAMTGYTSISKAYVLDISDSYIPFSEFQALSYVIHDGWRVNLTGEYLVPLDGVSGEILISSSSRPFSPADDCCSLQNNISLYVSEYGFYGLQDGTSSFLNTEIQSPSLNIEAFFVGAGSPLYGYNWTDPRAGRETQPFSNMSRIAYTYQNNTYFLSDIQSRGSCQPIPDRYQWGFSFIQLFIMIALLSIWTIGTYFMWLKARLQLPLEGQPEVPRRWKSILVLAEAINKELVESEINIQSMTDRQLEHEIYKHFRGGSVSFGIPLRRSGYSFRRGFGKWLKKEKWWFIALIFGLFVSILGPSSVLCAAIIFAMAVGQTTKSRILLAMTFGPLGLFIIPAWIISHRRDKKRQYE